jgi:hypothetical protein
VNLTNTGLGSAVGRTETSKDDGRRAAHRTKEGLLRVSKQATALRVALETV